MEPLRYTTAEKVSTARNMTTPRTPSDDLQGKDKAKEFQDDPEISTSMQRSSAFRSTESLPSPPTTPVQGARLPMNKRFPVRHSLPVP